LFALLLCVVACNRVKTTPIVKESYADGKPKVLTEYVTDEHGKRTLYKETLFFPGEKKYIEVKYDDAGSWDGVCTSWHENGNKMSEVKYVHGKEDGKYRVWHSNGKLFYKGQYNIGRKVGVWDFYDTLGTKTKREFYDKSGVKTKEEKY
jgi:antitoxin component YwqK of YwqJK toxin-antitoxin module